MRFIALLLLLLPLAFASPVGTFTATLAPEAATLNLSSAAYLNGTLDANGVYSYAGRNGNYTVSVSQAQDGMLISITGADSHQDTLSYELGGLIETNVIETKCDAGGFAPLSTVDYYCNALQEWKGCASPESCVQLPASAVTITPEPLRDTIGAAKTAEPAAYGQNAQPPSPAAPQAERGAAPAPQQAISVEQVIPLAAAFIAVIALSFLLLQQRQQTQEFDPQTLRLLENETRAGIMSELSLADKIPTDLSSKLGKSKATVVEHLETLVEAGFVERMATPGKKFVFYRLTQAGKRALLRRAG